MRKRFVQQSFVVALIAMLSLSGGMANATTAKNSGALASTGNVLNIGVILVPTQWDPAGFTWTQQLQLQQAAYDTLIHINPNGGFAPGLATSWKYVTPTKFTLTLRKNVKFTDGTPFNAAAVVTDLNHDKATVGPNTLYLADVSSVQATGNYGVTIRLSQPNSDLPLIFSESMGMMASPTALAAGGLGTTPVGAGPYILDPSQTQVNNQYTFNKNPNYWDAKDIHWKTLVFKLITDYTASVNALRSGQIAMALGQPATVSTAEAGGEKVVKSPGAVVYLNLQDRAGAVIPALGDVRVRQAINLAIDRQAISQQLAPGRPTSQLFPKGTALWVSDLDNTYNLNLKKAQSLMAAAGYSKGFAMPVLSFPLNDPVLQVIQSDLAQINITVTDNSVPIANYVTLRSTQQTAVWIGQISSTGSPYLDSLNVLTQNGLFNPFHSSTPLLTKELNTASASTTPTQKAKRYAEVAKTVQNLAWFAPVVQINTYYYYNKSLVSGVQHTAGQTVPFIYSWAPPVSR